MMSKGMITLGVMAVAAIAWEFTPRCEYDRMLHYNRCQGYQGALEAGVLQKNDRGEHDCFCANW
jgi:hypothetical protein